MAEYLVTLEGLSRETFVVEADSPEDAEKNWYNGDSQGVEAYSMGVVSVKEEEL